MCNCKKGIPANKSPILSGGFSAMGGNMRYTNNDFVVKYYVGETGNYTGSVTGIDYGVRTYNTKTMVHVSDLEADGHFFSDTEVESLFRSIKKEPEVITSSPTLDEQLDTLTEQIQEYAEMQATELPVVNEQSVDKKEVVYKKKPKKEKEVEENV